MLPHTYTIAPHLYNAAGIIAAQIPRSRGVPLPGAEREEPFEDNPIILCTFPHLPHARPPDPLCPSFPHVQPSVSGLASALLYTQ
jgi:hypothetical protein